MTLYYASIADLERAVGLPILQSLFPHPSCYQADIETFIEQSESLIHAALGARYATPLPLSPLLRRIAVDLTIPMLYARSESASLPEKFRQAAETARQDLHNLANGSLQANESQTVCNGLYVASENSDLT